MGKMENGKITITDPAMGMPKLHINEYHNLSDDLVNQPGWWTNKKTCMGVRASGKSISKDACYNYWNPNLVAFKR